MFHFSHCLFTLSTLCMPENPDTNIPLCDGRDASIFIRLICVFLHCWGNYHIIPVVRGSLCFYWTGHKSRNLRTVFDTLMVPYHRSTAKSHGWTSNSTWDSSRGGFLTFIHSVFHVHCKIPPCVRLMNNEWGPSCVISWYIIEIPNTSAPLWHLRLKRIPYPRVILSLVLAPDPQLHLPFLSLLCSFYSTQHEFKGSKNGMKL